MVYDCGCLCAFMIPSDFENFQKYFIYTSEHFKFNLQLNYKQIYNIKLIFGFAECGTAKLNYLFKCAGFK